MGKHRDREKGGGNGKWKIMTFNVVTNVYAGRVPEHQPIVPIKYKVVTLKLLNLVHIFPMDIQHSLNGQY